MAPETTPIPALKSPVPSGVTPLATQVPTPLHTPYAKYIPKNDVVTQGVPASSPTHCATAVGSTVDSRLWSAYALTPAVIPPATAEPMTEAPVPLLGTLGMLGIRVRRLLGTFP